jgi:hypothetical protein
MKKIVFPLFVLAMILSVNSLKAQGLEDILSQVATSTTKAEYDQEYKFDTYLQMEISGLGDNSVVYNLYTNKNGSSYAVFYAEGGINSVILLDLRNSSLLMLAEEGGEKSGMAMGINSEALAEMSAKAGETDKSYAEYKTGKKKDILGYSCDEYLIKEDGTEITLWASEKLGNEVSREVLATQQLFGGAFIQATGMNGMVMEYIFKDDSDEGEKTLKVTKIDLDARNSVKVSDYAIMTLGQ